MAREGGSYIKEKDGSKKLVHRTQTAADDKPKAAPKARKKPEVGTDENA